MSAALIERVSAVALAAAEAGHGKRGEIYRAACAELGISMNKLHSLLNQCSVRKPRKRRIDRGQTVVSRDECEVISAYLLEHMRKNGKRTKSVTQAVQDLRVNGIINAGRIDTETGEFTPLSDTTIIRALRQHSLHPDQLLAPEPVTPLISKHPNHVWQIDASLCVLYKLPDATGYGIEEVKTTERYKNKLSHFAKIEHRLVQRYLITDHATCAVFMYYAFGGESTESLCMLLVQAIQQRGQHPFYGIPFIIMLDRGSANRSATFRNLCHALGIELIFAQAARAKGQVEKMHDVTELGMESGLKMATHIRSVDQLNELAQRWAHWFNGTKKHSRHGKTRYAAWQLIKPEQLRVTELGTEELLLLARDAPKECQVTQYLTVHFRGAEYNVSEVPNVLVGEKLLICRSAFSADQAQAVLADEHGHEIFYPLAERKRDEVWGWFEDGALIGEEHKRDKDTNAQTARKQLERLAMNAESDTEAAANRKSKATPFGGKIDPYKEMNDYQPPVYLPKRSTNAGIVAPTVELQRLNRTQMAKWLQGRLRADYQPSMLAELSTRFPDGATEPELEQVYRDIQAGRSASGRAKLKVL